MENTKKKSHHRLRRKVVWKCLPVLKRQALEFCRETGLHGYKYVGESQRSITERIVWVVMAIASLCTAIVIIKLTYDHYTEDNLSSVIKSTHRGIWNYPFPAVTVCDFNRVSLKLTRDLVEKLKLPSTMSKEFIIQEMSLLNELVYFGRHEANIQYNLSRLQNIFDTNGLSIPTVIDSVTRDCESFLDSCKWQARELECSTMFRPSFTRYGMCCSFNYITHEQIIENPKLQPYKIASCGYQSGLNILLNLEPNDYHASSIGAVGFQVILHNSYDYPDFDAPSKLISIDKYSFISIQPEEMYATKTVQELPVSIRPCIFVNEGDMTSDNEAKGNFIPARYSFSNCMVQCRSTVIKAKCGCVPYYYPQNNTRVCNLRDIECLRKFKNWFESSWAGTDMSPRMLSFEIKKIDIKQRPCGCKPDCNFYHYNVENSIGNLNKRIYHNGLQYTNHASKGKAWKNQSIMHVFFGDLVSIQYRKEVHYSWRHIFATFGGLLGLFAGFSLMSIFEFIYFFLIRLIKDACEKRRNVETVK